jgi:tetratricopeptide (TPR) repeat protein
MHPWPTIALATALLLPGAATQEHEHGAGSERLGTVHFSATCNNPAQKQFDRAVALLHSFQFSRAIAGFEATLKADPSCAIAYWGIALSNWSNPFALNAKDPSQLRHGREAVDQGLALNPASDRERAYLIAVENLYADPEHIPQRTRVLHYRDAMASLAKRFPDDHEASIFYALSLAASQDPSDKTYGSLLKAGDILERLFALEPDHPGLAHYIIHTYDVPPLAAKAVHAAQRYSEIAPDTPHALHMPAHTFTRIGDWDDSIASNIAASAAARREGQTAEELHADDYLVYAYLQCGRDRSAAQLVNSLPNVSSRFDPKALIDGAAPPVAGYFALAAIPARYALEREDWQSASRLEVRESPFLFTDAMTYFARGLGAAHLGDAAAAETAAKTLDRLAGRLREANESYWSEQVEIQHLAVLAWAEMAKGRKEDALRDMAAAAEREDASELSAITPAPGPLKPARELLGEMFLQMHQPQQALTQFEKTLAKEPNRFRAAYGAALAAQLAQDKVATRKYFRLLLSVCAHTDEPARKELSEARVFLGSN